MTGRRIKVAGLAVLSAACVAVVSGCDAQENADLENGERLFTANCAQCHYLAAAGAVGDIGPDLDAAFAASRDAGMDQDTVEGVVADQIAHPRYTDPESPTYMAADIVTGSDADDVAAYVGSVAGVPGLEPPTAVGGPGGQVYADNGCGSCHVFAAAESVGAIGPNLDEVLPGQKPPVIENSIVNPDDEISQGFTAGIMPANYGEVIEPKDLELLVEFLYDNAGKPVKSN